MAKQQTFADKVMKAQRSSKEICSKCGVEYSNILYISSEKSEKTGSYKFNKRYTRVCKCNEKQIYG